MTLVAAAGFAAALGVAASEPPSLHPPPHHRAVLSDTTGQQIRVFFLSDAHSRHAAVGRFIEAVNRELPDLVLEGGDMVHDGTEPEFRRALADRARLHAPWYAVRGNHEAVLRGEFVGSPPRFPPFSTLDHAGLRLILLDNHDELLTEEQFQRLEAELRSHPQGRVIVLMHVPPRLSRKPAMLRLRHLVPFRLVTPVMRDPAQVERFTALMERHRVLAVLAGHAHFPDHEVRGGVHYLVAGALGGLTPGLGIANEYLDITIDERELRVERIAMGEPPGDPVRFVARAFRFFAELNRFNHAALGWRYVPSVSVQLKTAFKQVDAGPVEDRALYGAAAFERLLGESGRQALSAEIGLSAGSRMLAAHLETGYRVRPFGDFNRNLFVGGALTANGGILASAATAGVGARLGIGAEWRHLTAEASRNRSTNHRATTIAFGYRF